MKTFLGLPQIQSAGLFAILGIVIGGVLALTLLRFI